MKEFSVTMEISVNTTVEANSAKEARKIAMGRCYDDLSEFDRRVDMVENITPTKKVVAKGIGSY